MRPNETSMKNVFLSLSRLLSYPDDQLAGQLEIIAQLLESEKVEIQNNFKSFRLFSDSGTVLELQQHYVETFDQKRSSCLYLSFFLNGDTRQRGMALWRFANVYRESGFELDSGELPDFLPALLDFTATVDFQSGLKLLQTHQRALLVLEKSLEKQESPYHFLLSALIGVLPTLSQKEMNEAEALINAGPPKEMVGLEGYGGPVSVTIGVRP